MSCKLKRISIRRRDSAADSLTIESTTADKGYHAVAEMKQLQAEGIRTVISDPVKNRKLENLDPEDAQVVRQAKRSAGSRSGKELLRRRGMHLERSFAHILDAGGARRTTLRGLGNLNKRFKVSAAIYNLSQLMRKLFGVGTPKQLAAMGKALFLVWRTIVGVGCGLFRMDRTNRAERHKTNTRWNRLQVSAWSNERDNRNFRLDFSVFQKELFFNGLLGRNRSDPARVSPVGKNTLSWSALQKNKGGPRQTIPRRSLILSRMSLGAFATGGPREFPGPDLFPRRCFRVVCS